MEGLLQLFGLGILQMPISLAFFMTAVFRDKSSSMKFWGTLLLVGVGCFVLLFAALISMPATTGL